MAATKYRFLRFGEVIEKGDECCNRGETKFRKVSAFSIGLKNLLRGVRWVRRPLKSTVISKPSSNKRSAAPKAPPKSAKRRLRTATRCVKFRAGLKTVGAGRKINYLV
jgi:hypothetical protein